MAKLNDGDNTAAMDLIESQLDAIALELAIARANFAIMEDYVQIKAPKERRKAFYRMARDLIHGKLILPKALHDKLRSALLHLNKHDYYHNDLHERNIMVSSDRKDIFIIDLATATYGQHDAGGDIGILAPQGLFHTATCGHTNEEDS